MPAETAQEGGWALDYSHTCSCTVADVNDGDARVKSSVGQSA